ncbi:hypothetical protein CRM22_000794 [Opisthorchis felineus]|uniref:RAVE complex protein Rav1 C-terminal domain-containing protein n=1 Tax=Opisthorchis felineus TaxID=147828 RepID=A0A4S2MDS0_OPIFE|nr:hypothetical protein CRM22_000794 [Opisthorchis felineus]
MRLHQVLTGSCNATHNHASHGVVSGINFVAYASGCDVVILNECFIRVQIIPWDKLDGLIVQAVSCSHYDGKIAVANSKRIYIYSPKLSTGSTVRCSLSNVTWYLQHCIDLPAKTLVCCLAWSHESCFSTRKSGLLVAKNDGQLIMWRPPFSPDQSRRTHPPKFLLGSSPLGSETTSVGELSMDETSGDIPIPPQNSESWKSLSIGNLPGTPLQMEFSPDGRYFATLFQSPGDKTTTKIFVWFQANQHLPDLDDCSSGDTLTEERWEHMVLHHPVSVLYFTWRSCSPYLPVGWVPNVLLTSSEDRVCRLWVEVLKLNPSVSAPATGSAASMPKPPQRTDVHNELLATITMPIRSRIPPSNQPAHRHMAGCSPDLDSQPGSSFSVPSILLHHPVLRRLLELWLADPFDDTNITVHSTQPATQAADTFQHCSNNYCLPQFAFAASLDLDSFQGLSAGSDLASSTHQFVLHWLNNKVHRLNEKMRQLLLDSVARIMNIPSLSTHCTTTSIPADSPMPTLTDHLAVLDQSVEAMISEWQHAPDVVLSILPNDGSLVVWYIHGLDTSVPNPAGLRVQYVPLLENGTRTGAIESSFTMTPSSGHTRLTQVTSSLRSRLHEAFPVIEAASLQPGVFLFLTATPSSHHQHIHTDGSDQATPSSRDISTLFCRLMILLQLQHSKAEMDPVARIWRQAALSGLSETQLLGTVFATKFHQSQYVAMVTRHFNGSLRYWRLDVSKSSQFQWIVGVNGSARLSGHRFHTEAIVSHPLLPLVLSNSHYELKGSSVSAESFGEAPAESVSELILWRVDPVGPLTSSSGTVGGLGHRLQHCHHTSAAHRLRFTVEPSDISQSGGSLSRGGLFEVARVSVPKPPQQLRPWFHEIAWFPCVLTTALTQYPVALFVANTAVSQSKPCDDQLGFFLAFADAGDELQQTLGRGTTTKSTDEEERLLSLTNADTSGCIIQLRTTVTMRRVDPPKAASFTPQTLLLHVFPSELVARVDLQRTTPLRPLTAHSSHTTYLIVRLTGWRRTTEDRNEFVDYCPRTRLEMWRVRVATEASPSQSPPESLVPLRLSAFDDLLCDLEKVNDCELPLPSGVLITRAEVSAAHVSWATLSTYNAPPPYLIVSACSDGCLRFWRCVAQQTGSLLGGETFTWSEWQMPLAHALSSCIELDSHHPPKILDVDCAYSGRIAVAYAPLTSEGAVSVPVPQSGLSIPKILVVIYECESSGGCEWILEDTIDLSLDFHQGHSHRNQQLPAVVQLDWVSTEDGGHLLSIMLGSQVLVYAPTCQTVNPTQSHPHAPSTLMTTLGEVYLTWKRVASTRVYTAHVGEHQVVKSNPLYPVPSGRHKRAIWLRDGLLLIAVTTEILVYSQWPNEAGHHELSTMEQTIGAEEPTVQKKLTDKQRSHPDAAPIPQPDDATVAGTASMTVAQLTKTYSAYLLKPSPSAALLANMVGLRSPATKPHTSAGGVSPKTKPSSPNTVGTSSGPDEVASSLPTTTTHAKPSPIETADPALLADLGLFESIQIFNPVMPQFHPRQLLEWLNLGRLRRVQAILAHLTRCLTASSPALASISRRSAHRRNSVVGEVPGWSGEGTQPNSATGEFGPTSGATSSTAGPVPLLDAQTIPPVPLYVLLAIDSLQTNQFVAENESGKRSTVFDPLDDSDVLTLTDESELFKIQDDADDATDLTSPTPKFRADRLRAGRQSKDERMSAYGAMSMWSLKPSALAAMCQFRPEDAQLLAEHLTVRQLPGLSPLDQMYLLGIADLMANVQTDVTDRLGSTDPDASSVPIKDGTTTSTRPVQPNHGLDECGLRFLLTVQLYSYLSRTLPPARRAQLLSSGLTNSSLAWAFHSDATEELLARIPTKQFSPNSEELTWVEFKRYGCGWWIRSDTLLRRCVEKIARTSFQQTKDPMESVVFYAAMCKANVVAGLFKSIGNKTLENFFRSDFGPGRPACRQAKLNAFRLLSQHRYTHAAGLFLLAGCLDDAIRVCLDTLKDLQLAVVLVRLYMSSFRGMDQLQEESPFHRLLRQHVITNEDPFLRSMAFWSLGDPLASLRTLLQGPEPISTITPPVSRNATEVDAFSVNLSPQHPQLLEKTLSLVGSEDGQPRSSSTLHTSVYPSVFKFYTFLRKHPLVLRQWRVGTSPTSIIDSPAMRQMTCLERRLYFRTAHHYSALGCPTLALEVLSKIPPLLPIVEVERRASSIIATLDRSLSGNVEPMEALATASQATLVPTSSGRDMNVFSLWDNDDDEPVSSTPNLPPMDPFKIELSDSDSDHSNPIPEASVQPVESATGLTRNSVAESSICEEAEGMVDLIANQLKFIACLKILSEELSTLASGAEAEGVGLRKHVWHWLERELAVVHVLTAAGQLPLQTADTWTNTDFFHSAAQQLLEKLTNFHLTEPPTSNRSGQNQEEYQEDFTCRGPLTTPSFLIFASPTSGDQSTIPKESTTGRAYGNDAAIILDAWMLPKEVRQAETNRIRTRHRWLKSHEAFLTSLINFCGLYGASGVGLPAVRIELLFLLTELHTYPARPVSSSNDAAAVTSTGNPSVPAPTVTRGYQTHSWLPSTTVGLVDGVPLLRTVLHLPPGALLLPDPVKHIQCMIQDLMACLEGLPPPYLTTVILPCPHRPNSEQPDSSDPPPQHYCIQCAWAPTPHRQRHVFLLRNLCAALAVAMHQSLSTGGWFGPGQTTEGLGSTSGVALPASSSMNIRSVERLQATKQPLQPNTEPSKWPGLTTLRKYIQLQVPFPQPLKPVSSALTVRKLSVSESSASTTTLTTTLQPVNQRHLIGLLAQALAATYLGLIVYALHTRDACVLYRLAAARLDSATWAKVFGGAYRAKPFRPRAPPGSTSSKLRPAPPPPPAAAAAASSRPPRPQRGGAQSRLAAIRATKRGTSISESGTIPPQPSQTDAEISGTTKPPVASVGQAVPPSAQPPPPPDEWFVPPQYSMLTCLLSRPLPQGALSDDPSQIFDSDESEPPEGYESYTSALAARQRRLRRAYGRSRSANNRAAQRKAKEELRRRLAKRTGIVDSSDEEDQVRVPQRLDELYPELAADGTATTSEQPRWILRLLCLDPDIVDSSFCLGTAWESADRKGAFRNDSSEDENENELDVDNGVQKTTSLEAEKQWANGDSYAWRLMRLSIMQLAKVEIDRLIHLLDFSTDDLAVHAPGLVTAARSVDMWMASYRVGLTAPPTLTPLSLTRLSQAPEHHLLPPPQFLPDIESHLEGVPGPGKSVAGALGDKPELAEVSSQFPSAGATRSMLRLRHLTNPTKTPFQTQDPFSLPTKRLWCYLVRQPTVDDTIVRHVFRQPRVIQSIVVPTSVSPPSPVAKPTFTLESSSASSSVADKVPTSDESLRPVPHAGPGRTTRQIQSTLPTCGVPGSLLFDDAVRLIHKEHDPLIAMCLNQCPLVNHGYIAVATPKEVIELNVENLVTLPAWYADEVEYDLELMRRPKPHIYMEGGGGGTDDFVILDSPYTGTASTGEVPGGPMTTTHSSKIGGSAPATADHGHPHVILKRSLPAVYSLASHPILPYYLSGTGTGSVHLFEWATTIPLIAGFTNTYALTPAGASGQGPAGSRGARVTAIHFDHSGRRFGCGDADGNFGLWNLQTTTPDKPPYFRCRCHAKGLADFCFVGSSSLIATVGAGTGPAGPSLPGGLHVTGHVSTGEQPGPGGISAVFSADQDGANLALWDALLPPHRSCVIRVTDPELESPCTAISHFTPSLRSSGWPQFLSTSSTLDGLLSRNGATPFALGSVTRDRLVAVGTKRGEVCFVDLRQPKVMRSFAAHDSAIRTLCIDPTNDCLITGGADGQVKIWRLSEHELINSFYGDFYQGRGAAALAAAALFRGNQTAAIIAATYPGISKIKLLPLVPGASLLQQGKSVAADGSDVVQPYYQNQDSIAAVSAACRFISCGADGGLRMRSFIVRPKPFCVC